MLYALVCEGLARRLAVSENLTEDWGEKCDCDLISTSDLPSRL